MSVQAQIQHFSPEVDFSTPASRQPVPFKVDVDVSDPTGKEYNQVGEVVTLRGVIDEINGQTPLRCIENYCKQ